MKYLVKFFVITFFVLTYTHVSAEQTIVYLDMKYILNNSKPGKEAQDFLKNRFEKNQEKFTNEETKLKKAELDLIEKKNILSQDEYKQKADELRKNVGTYQSERRKSLEEIAIKRAKAKQDLIKAVNPIIKKYIDENNISLVIDKKDVVGGNKNYDITEIIIEKLNKELPSLNLK